MQVVQVVYIPFVTQRLIPMVLVTMEIPQLLVDKVVDALVMQVVQVSLHPCRGAEAVSLGLGCSADHRDSPVAL